MRIPTVELEGYEADDLLATLTKHLRQEGNEVLIVTGDRDILQLVGDGVSVAVAVAVGDGVLEGVAVGVLVAVGVSVAVGDGVAV